MCVYEMLVAWYAYSSVVNSFSMKVWMKQFPFLLYVSTNRPSDDKLLAEDLNINVPSSVQTFNPCTDPLDYSFFVITDYLTPAQILLFQAVMIKFTIDPFNSSEQVYKNYIFWCIILFFGIFINTKEGILIDAYKNRNGTDHVTSHWWQ